MVLLRGCMSFCMCDTFSTSGRNQSQVYAKFLLRDFQLQGHLLPKLPCYHCSVCTEHVPLFLFLLLQRPSPPTHPSLNNSRRQSYPQSGLLLSSGSSSFSPPFFLFSNLWSSPSLPLSVFGSKHSKSCFWVPNAEQWNKSSNIFPLSFNFIWRIFLTCSLPDTLTQGNLQ